MSDFRKKILIFFLLKIHAIFILSLDLKSTEFEKRAF